MKIAIIGAGLSGITAAKTLSARMASAADITIFEKSRGVGGRMSTRRTDDFEFDHGAQYFTAKDAGFKAAVNAAIDQGHIAPWTGKAVYLKDVEQQADTGGARYVSVPRMNSWIKTLAEGLNIQTSVRISGLVKAGNGWRLQFEGDAPEQTLEQTFDAVICALPAPQAHELLAPAGFAEISAIQSTKMDACFALMLGFHSAQSIPWDTLRSADGPASWIAVNSAKPGRPSGNTTVMVHSWPKWSNANVDRDKAQIQAEMTAAASALMGIDASHADYVTLHRWLYAAVSEGAGQACLTDEAQSLVVCGDWCLGGRVEGAWLSGKAAAEAILDPS